MKTRTLLAISLLCNSILTLGCGAWSSAESKRSSVPVPSASPLPSDQQAAEGAIRFLEARVKNDPDDFIAHNKLADYYLQRLRETGNLEYLALTRRTVSASLKAMPAEQNTAGVGLLAQVEFTSHEFAASRDVAKRLIGIESHRSYPFQLLGDALLELGDYQDAERAYREMERRESFNVRIAVRFGRLAMLRGETDEARKLYIQAIGFAIEEVPRSRESVAWCHWQLAELEFGSGNYDKAGESYQASLVTFPDYYRALAGLGRVRAAQGDTEGAIGHFERAVQILPDPSFLASLGDLYLLAGRTRDAETQFQLVEKIGQIGESGGSVYDRQLANFYADHDLQIEKAYRLAMREYELRKDVHGADTLAWTALKAGKIVDAQKTIKEAMRLGTKDARLFYHAGMIEHASGNRKAGDDLLGRALKLSPQFDPRQAMIARKTLSK